MLMILPSSSTRAILLTSLAIYSCIPLKAIQYYINVPLDTRPRSQRGTPRNFIISCFMPQGNTYVS